MLMLMIPPFVKSISVAHALNICKQKIIRHNVFLSKYFSLVNSIWLES